jgi:hypothetical protein
MASPGACGARELAIMCALLNNDKVVDFAESLPDLSELCHHQLPKKRPNADVSEIITFPANRAAAGGIVTVLGMVKHLLHEPSKRLRAAVANLVPDELDQSSILDLRPQRPTLNAPRRTLNCESAKGRSMGRWMLGVERWAFRP